MIRDLLTLTEDPNIQDNRLWAHPLKENETEDAPSGCLFHLVSISGDLPPGILFFFSSVPGGKIPRVETNERECWEFLDWRLASENDSLVRGQPSFLKELLF